MASAAVFATAALACGDAAQDGAAAEEPTAQPADGRSARPAAVSEPTPEQLFFPPPPHARFDAGLSASARAQVQMLGGYERRVGGTEGTFVGRDPEIYVFVTDQPFQEVVREYRATVGSFGSGGEVEEDPLAAGHPDELQRAAAEYGLPQDYVDAYRELYPQLQGRTGSSTEFAFSDRVRGAPEGPPDSYNEVGIRIANPYVDLNARQLHEQTVIEYVIVTMERVDGR